MDALPAARHEIGRAEILRPIDPAQFDARLRGERVELGLPAERREAEDADADRHLARFARAFAIAA